MFFVRPGPVHINRNSNGCIIGLFGLSDSVPHCGDTRNRLKSYRSFKQGYEGFGDMSVDGSKISTIRELEKQQISF